MKPEPGYLEGLRQLADEQGFLLIFDEVKTGFRHALPVINLSECGARFIYFRKSSCNGYPLGSLQAKKNIWIILCILEKSERVMIAGTFNAFPLTTAAAIATLRKLGDEKFAVYEHVEKLGALLEKGYQEIFLN